MAEYNTVLTLTKSEVITMRKTQNALRRYSIQTSSESQLLSALGAISGLSGIFTYFVTSVTFGALSAFAGYCISLVSYINNPFRETLLRTSLNGSDYLLDMEDYVIDNNLKAIKINVPMIEIIENRKKLRFVAGRGELLGVQTATGTWVTMG